MRLGFRIATRFLKSNKGQTLLIILGIAIGVSVQIFIGSLIQGLQKSLLEKTIGNSSQITITSDTEESNISDYNQLVQTVEKVDDRIKSISASVNNPAFLEYETESQSILIRGFHLEQADEIYQLTESMVEGVLPEQTNEIMLGINLKEEYGISLGSKVSIITAEQKTVPCTVVGFFDLKVASLNEGWGITTLEAAQSIFETGDIASSIEMQVKDTAVFEADLIADEIDSALNKPEFKVVHWKEQNESLLSGLQGQSISSYMIQIFVMISVILGIASVLAITVIQKSKQIGILKAMGIRNSSTSFIFLFEGLILGVYGAVLGILFGLGLAVAFTKFAVNPDGTPVIALFIDPAFILISGLIAVVASVLAALIPAVGSSRLNPIDIIRNN